MTKLTDLPNIGPHAAGQLAEVGIETAEDLLAIGAEQAWLKMQVVDPGVCIMQLYDLEGAVQGIPKKELGPARKQELKAFAAANKPA
ncbi:transcriptional regulator [Gordonibacter sp. 28C]|uniref:TfoX/Sxy family protein n=1 Tax=Gordonibacter sp. 28C TaxID=2078569 RepID=UPI000DF8238C|nr:TfoX/Sxy family protein [Gordonibacter sp. 28C]RDB61585.1 transcriptional regulator [Gordonibacter sp. 28C]